MKLLPLLVFKLLQLLLWSMRVKKGDYVLVHAAAGGVGSLLIQIIRSQGGTVIASTSTDEKVEFCKKLGADYAINYKKEDTIKRVLEITKGEGVHVALDSVGRVTFDSSVASLRPFGVVILYGWASGPVENVSLRVILLLYKLSCLSILSL
jgi:NADPH2:quinone reductase